MGAGGAHISRDAPGDCAGCVGEHASGDAVQACDIDDRVHHGDVFGADIGACVTGGDGGDEDLGHADG